MTSSRALRLAFFLLSCAFGVDGEAGLEVAGIGNVILVFWLAHLGGH